MRRVLATLVVLTAMVFGGVIGRTLFTGDRAQEVVPSEGLATARDSLKATADRLMAPVAGKSNSDLTVDDSAIIRDNAIAEMRDSMVTITSNRERFEMAAGNFAGFLYINEVTRKRYCQRLGVDLSVFVSTFKDVHRTEIAAVNNSHLTLALLYESLLDAEELQDTYYRVIDTNMTGYANTYNVTRADACRSFNANADEISANYAFRVLQPDIYAVLIHEN